MGLALAEIKLPTILFQQVVLAADDSTSWINFLIFAAITIFYAKNN